MPECARLTGSPEEEAKQINDTAKQLEDREIKEAIEKSKREQGDGSPSTATTPGTSGVNSTVIQPGDNFTEDVIKEIVKMGFTRDKVVTELRTANGNKTQAVAALFAKSLKF